MFPYGLWWTLAGLLAIILPFAAWMWAAASTPTLSPDWWQQQQEIQRNYRRDRIYARPPNDSERPLFANPYLVGPPMSTRIRLPAGAHDKVVHIHQYLPAPLGGFWRAAWTGRVSSAYLVIDWCEPWMTEDYLVVTYE